MESDIILFVIQDITRRSQPQVPGRIFAKQIAVAVLSAIEGDAEVLTVMGALLAP